MHWTNASIDDFTFSITASFVRQVLMALEAQHLNRADLARKLGVTESAVSQTLNNVENLSIKTLVKYARALNLKVAIVIYDDKDLDNINGPVAPEIIAESWYDAGRPGEFRTTSER